MVKGSGFLVSLFVLPLLLAQDGLLGSSLPAEFRAFSEDSPYNTAIPPNPSLDPFSKQMVAQLKKAGALKADHANWSVPVFVIDESLCPKVTIRARDQAFHPSVDPKGLGLAMDVPFPNGVWPDPEKDGHMVLVDPKIHKAWDFSRLQGEPGGRWSATRVDVWDLNDRGYRRAFSGPAWWMGGARASGIPLLAGLVRPEEIERGQISHALVFACPDVRKSSEPGGERQLCSPPASRSDGLADGFQFIPMGARLQLDPSLDLNSLGLSAETKVIAFAMQVYGMFLCDGSETFKIYFQNIGVDGGAWQKIGSFTDLRRIPTEAFRVLQCNYRLELPPKKP